MQQFSTPDELLYHVPEAPSAHQSDSLLPVSSGAKHARAASKQQVGKGRRLTKRQRKEEKRLRVAVLKQMVKHPDLIDMYDVSSPDPLLLAHLKSTPNTVPVPRHWKRKRRYLQGKRGKEKVAFQLPEYIANTGIASMRAAQLEKEGQLKAKQKGRARMQPKMHRLDIDYKVLKDAFFKHQTKPKVTGHGDLYYEGKEYEVDIKNKRPGYLSPALRQALDLEEGSPPPWLHNMQRLGPPPSYPQLRIPGVNAPLPPGAEYGPGPRQWGRPPTDEYGRGIYGDVLGTPGTGDDETLAMLGLQQPVQLWGQMQQELYGLDMEESSSSSEEEEEEEEEDEQGGEQARSSSAPAFDAVQAAIQAPAALQLRKGSEQQPQKLVQVLKQRDTSVGNSMYGSSFSYVIPGEDASTTSSRRSQKTGEQVITLDSMDLEDMESGAGAALLRDKFEAAQEAGQPMAPAPTDMSEIHAEHQPKKRKRKKAKTSEYKF